MKTSAGLAVRLAGAIGFAFAALGMASGCAAMPRKAKVAPPPQERNFVGDKRLPQPLVRVVILPVWAGEVAPSESAAALDSVFATELGRQKRFEVVSLSREECRRRFGEESLSSASALPLGMLEELARDFGAQGVVFVDITTYHPIRPIAIGIRSKLALTSTARVIWDFDDVYTAEDRSVLEGLKKFYAPAGGDRSEMPNNLPEAALLSPTRFAAYAANATFQTLPAR